MSQKRLKITFIIPSLSAGGAERILSFVANNLDYKKFECTLLVVGFQKDTVYSLGNLHVIYLNKTRILNAFFSFIKYFRTKKPDVVMSSIFHLNTLIAYLSVFFPRIKFVAREANVLSVLTKYSSSNTKKFPKFLVVTAYKLVDCLVCQSQDMQLDMTTNYGVALHKTALINNPITQVFTPKTTVRKSKSLLKIITIGRLSKEKGHDRIIEVLSKLKFPFHYTMIGNGDEKENIMNLIHEYGLNNKITHITYTKDVEQHLEQSDVFLQGSYSEGFPNALIESCVVGTPIVAFNAPGGLNEIIENGQNGIIIHTIDQCIEQLTKLNTNFTFNSKQVNHVVTKRFNSSKIIGQYEDLFFKLTS